jgi:hypothetical protein
MAVKKGGTDLPPACAALAAPRNVEALGMNNCV